MDTYLYFISSFLTIATAAALYFFKKPYSLYVGSAVTAAAVSAATLFFSAYSCVSFCSAIFPNKLATFLVMSTALPGVILYFYQTFADSSPAVWFAPFAALLAVRLTRPSILGMFFEVDTVPVFVSVVSLLLLVTGVVVLTMYSNALFKVVGWLAVSFSLLTIFVLFPGSLVMLSSLMLLALVFHWTEPFVKRRKVAVVEVTEVRLPRTL